MGGKVRAAMEYEAARRPRPISGGSRRREMSRVGSGAASSAEGRRTGSPYNPRPTGLGRLLHPRNPARIFKAAAKPSHPPCGRPRALGPLECAAAVAASSPLPSSCGCLPRRAAPTEFLGERRR